MTNHDTFNFANVLDFDNWVIVFMAMWKMFTFFWPVAVAVIILVMIEKKMEET